MLKSNSISPIRTSTSRPSRVRTLCVVDRQSQPYEAWQSLARAQGAQVRILASAAEALRFARTHSVDLWVVNTNLPGLSGCELCSMLRSRGGSAPVYLMADQYSPEIEQAAWRARATLFGVKGGCDAWLQAWLSGQSATSRLNSIADPPLQRAGHW